MARSQPAPPPQAEAPAAARTPGPLPDVFEVEEREHTALVPVGSSSLAVPSHITDVIQRLLLVESSAKVEALIKTRETFIAQLQAVAIKSTTPKSWTLYKDKAGNEVGVLRDAGAVAVRKWMGISITNHRPQAGGVAEARISDEEVPAPPEWDEKERRKVEVPGKTVRVKIAEMWADGHCALTGETITDVYMGLRTIDGFVGRGHVQDLKASCRTSLDTKVVRILSGLRKVDIDTLKSHGIDVAKCYLGSGYGTSTDRTAGRVADEGLKPRLDKFRDELLKRVGGDADAARSLLKDVTYWKKGDKDGWAKTVEQITEGWQLDKAIAALAKHPQFGDEQK
jgi:hypothetical protein